MQEAEFNHLVEDKLEWIEQSIDDCGFDIDAEIIEGVLTLTFEDDSKIIISRQIALNQIWVATRSGGFHFDYDKASNIWVNDSSKEELLAALSRYCSKQSGEQVLLPK